MPRILHAARCLSPFFNTLLWRTSGIGGMGMGYYGLAVWRRVVLAGAKAMFDEAKLAHGEPGQDQDLLDHLNPQSSFALDIGGQG